MERMLRILQEVASAGFEVRSLPEGNVRRTLSSEGGRHGIARSANAVCGSKEEA